MYSDVVFILLLPVGFRKYTYGSRYNDPPPFYKRYGHPQTGEPWRQGSQDG